MLQYERKFKRLYSTLRLNPDSPTIPDRASTHALPINNNQKRSLTSFEFETFKHTRSKTNSELYFHYTNLVQLTLYRKKG